MQRSITALFTRSLIRRSFAPSTTTSSLLVRQLHAGRRLADEFAAAAASPSSSDGSFSGRPGRTGGRRPERLPNGVFVGGLSHTMQEDDLKRVFGRIGEVKAANVVFDRDTQRSKRWAVSLC